MSANTWVALNGITAQEIRAKVMVTIGANIKITLLELEGIITSLNMYFNASAKDWSKPKGHTTFGPCLFEQMPKSDDQAKQSSQQKQELVLIKIRFYMSLKKLYLNIPFY